MRRLEKDGGIFRVLPTDEVRRRMDELRAVSDDWLRTRSVAEKGFSLGCFEPDYVARFPAAIVECGRRIEAFATLWPGLMGQEVSTDLMRHHRDAPKSVMEALFTHLMIWGRAEGYRWFVMGMAPMSGFESTPICAAVGSCRAAVVRTRHTALQLSGSARVQEQIRSGVGVEVSRVSRRARAAAHRSRRVRAGLGRLSADLREVRLTIHRAARATRS